MAGGSTSEGDSGAMAGTTGAEADWGEISSPVFDGGTAVQLAEIETKASRISIAELTLHPPHPFGKGPLSFLMQGLYQIVGHL